MISDGLLWIRKGLLSPTAAVNPAMVIHRLDLLTAKNFVKDWINILPYARMT